MVLVCEFNPKLIRYYKVVDFMKNNINTYSDKKFYAGGNGLDIAFFSKQLGYSPKVLTFLGGSNGQFIKEFINKSDIELNAINIKDNSVENLVIKSRTLQTVIKSNDAKMTVEDMQNFYSEFSKEVENKKFVCFVADDEDFYMEGMYKDFIDISRKKGVRIAVSVSNVKYISDAVPYMILLDKETLEDYSKLKIKTQSEALKASNVLLDKGIKIVVLNSENSIVIITNDVSYRVNFIENNNGNKNLNHNLFLAGLFYSVEKDYDFETMIKFAIACGLDNNFYKFSEVDMANIKSLMKNIVLNKIGGKNEEL